MTTVAEVLEFWFSDHARTRWFNGSREFDDEIRIRFGRAVDDAIAGSYVEWESATDGVLALVVLLDQFTRNIFRGTPHAFAGDPRALRLARTAVDAGLDRILSLEQRMFMYMPFQHSEVLADQTRSVELFTGWVAAHDEASRKAAEQDLFYAQRHHEIIQRFGRFPHRNAILGRASTPEEIAFLKTPNSSF